MYIRTDSNMNDTQKETGFQYNTKYPLEINFQIPCVFRERNFPVVRVQRGALLFIAFYHT